jgi:hypothetical protein
MQVNNKTSFDKKTNCMLDEYGLRKKIVACVKNERANLSQP